MDIERSCSVCGDEAPMFCRMCSLAYCPEHLCLHLNVAWESNSWTKRNTLEVLNEAETIREYEEPGSVQAYQEPLNLPNPEKTLLSYTDLQLQQQYDFYLTQARRIRNELERRATPCEDLSIPRKGRYVFQPRDVRAARAPSKRRVSKSTTNAVQFLVDSLRSGVLSYEQLVKALG